MYTILPLVDQSQTHLGLYIGTFMLLCLAGVVMFFYLQGNLTGKEASWTSLALASLMLMIGYASYSVPAPTNEKVVAKFERFLPTQIIKNGKITSTSNVVYGVFEVEGGKVSLPVDATKPVAPYVYLYKN